MSAWHNDGEEQIDAPSAAEAQREAEASISRWRPVAGESDAAWPVEYVERVAWGLTIQQAAADERGTACRECGEQMPEVLSGDHLHRAGGRCIGEVVPTAEYELRDAPGLLDSLAGVLQARPELVVRLADQLLVAGRWERMVMRFEGQIRVSRQSPFRYVATCVVTGHPGHRWQWEVWDGGILAQGTADTEDEAMTACDEAAVAHGWALVGGVHRSKVTP